MLLSLLLTTEDDGTSSEGDTNSDLSEDSLTVLCPDCRLEGLEATIEDNDL